jgi:hypothetical protein
MLPLLAPILAQLVTLSLGDRTEGRYVASDDKHFEAETRPSVGLTFVWPRVSLTLQYLPFIVAPQIDTDPSYVLVFNTGVLAGAYRWRRTVLNIGESAGYGERNLTSDALGAARTPIATLGGPTTGPTQPGMMPGPTSGTTTGTSPTPSMPATSTPSTAQPRALSHAVLLQTFTTSVGITHRPSLATSVHFDASYVVQGGVGSAAQKDYPLVKGPVFNAAASDRLTGADRVTTSVSAQYAGSGQPNAFGIESRTWLTAANERLDHAFDAHTVGRVGAGISVTRNSQSDGLIGYSIYPTFDVGLTQASRLGGGHLALSIGVYSSPALDPVNVVVDPRVGALTSAGWSRDRFYSALAAATALSLAGGHSEGALNSANGSFTTGYRLGAVVSVDGGVRATWQSYQGTTSLPLTWGAFIGINFVSSVLLD